jgi:hypothetical protein
LSISQSVSQPVNQIRDTGTTADADVVTAVSEAMKSTSSKPRVIQVSHPHAMDGKFRNHHPCVWLIRDGPHVVLLDFQLVGLF